MIILGIESTCDETAAALVEDGRHLLSNVISTSVKEQALYGGVVPEIASRRHCEFISATVDKALADAGMTMADVDAVAVTFAPGLIGAVLVGVNFAKGLAYSAGKPLVPVHHLRGHIAALYLTHPDLSEGRLAKLRAAVVNARALAGVARGIGLGEHIKLGRGELTTGGREKASILSDTVEAVIGAIHLSAGIEESRRVVHLLFDPVMAAAADMGAGLDWKTSLQELTAELGLGVPEYVIEDDGPDHMKTFTAQVRVGEDLYGHGVGRSKKEAEQGAAETAYGELRAAGPVAPDAPTAD